MRRLNSRKHARAVSPPGGLTRLARLLLFAVPFLLALSTPARLEAQKDGEKKQAQSGRCPNIALCCHASVKQGMLGPFTATLGGTDGVKPSFNWKLSAGQVAEGQGTQEILIDTKGLKGGTLIATLEVGGFGPRCSATCVAELPGAFGVGVADSRQTRLATLSVSVKSALDGRPVPNAKVNVYRDDGSFGGQAETDARGSYASGGWKPGAYRVEVFADRFERQESKVTLDTASAGAVALSLKPLAAPPTPTPTPSPSPTPTITPTPNVTPSSAVAVTTPNATATPTPGTGSKSLIASITEGPNLFWPALAVLAALAAAGYLLSTKMAGGAAGETVASPSEGTAAGAGTTKQADEVQCTAYAPPSAQPDNSFLVQVFAHLKEQAGELDALAAGWDADARRYGSQKLGAAIERGRELSFTLKMPGLEIDDPTQSIVWNGEVECVPFGVTVPADFKPKTVIGTVTVAVSNAEGAQVPVGTLKFVFKVAAAAAPQPAAAPPAQPPAAPEQSYTAHKRAFISYASPNRPEVQKRVQMLLAEGVECYMDVLTFRPGERWESNIYQYIDRSDIFYLFWSEAAKGSPWVKQEITYALKRKGDSELAPPEIMPIILEGPPIVPPPDELKHLHFNDPILYFIKVEEAARRPPAQV